MVVAPPIVLLWGCVSLRVRGGLVYREMEYNVDGKGDTTGMKGRRALTRCSAAHLNWWIFLLAFV